MYFDMFSSTYNSFIKIGMFNSENLEISKYRYEKMNSEGDTHNAELCGALWITYIELKSFHPLIMILHYLVVFCFIFSLK